MNTVMYNILENFKASKIYNNLEVIEIKLDMDTCKKIFNKSKINITKYRNFGNTKEVIVYANKLNDYWEIRSIRGSILITALDVHI